MTKNLSMIALFAAVLLIGLTGVAGAASVTVAASNSQVKSSAAYVCDGSNDQAEIRAAIDRMASSGGDVILLDGTFTLNGDVGLTRGVNLIGSGVDATTLNFVGEGWIEVKGSNTVRDLQTTGATGFLIIGSHVRMTGVTVRNYTGKSGAFHIYACNQALSDFVFTNCNAIDGSSHGFLNVGEGSPRSVSDITYSGCTAINCGRASQYNPWITGFDFAESADIVNMLVEDCRAEGCWESGFHFEVGPQKTSVILRNCVSINNGQKKTRETPKYGAGFIGGSPTMQFIDCTSESNQVGFYLMSGATATRCKDIGSTYGFRTTDYNTIVLNDCESDLAQKWAFFGINSQDVTATNFKVTNPAGNPYPAVLAGSPNYPSYNMDIQLVETTAAQAPVALFEASVTSGKAPLTVQFSDLSTGNPTTWSWNFGDGSPITTATNPSHDYVRTGTYVASLTVSNALGSSTTSKTTMVITPMTPVPPSENAPRDLNNDGLYEDINGNGLPDFNDVVTFFNQIDWITENEPAGAFDFNNNGQIDFNDIVTLFNELQE